MLPSFIKEMPIYQKITHIRSLWQPYRCCLCGFACLDSPTICNDCLQNLPSLPHHCHICAQILHGATNTTLYCGNCLLNPPPYQRVHALFPYEIPIAPLIIKLKFQHQLSIATAFGELMRQAVTNTWYRHAPLPTCIIPVPLHPLRLRERGFNQAVEIGRPIAKALGIPLDMDGTKRIKHTAMQSSLTAAARLENMEHAFSVRHDYTHRHVAVIDDVMTTGHTVSAFCTALKRSGAACIDVWCVARCS